MRPFKVNMQNTPLDSLDKEIIRLLVEDGRIPNVAWAGVVTGRYDIMVITLCITFNYP